MLAVLMRDGPVAAGLFADGRGADGRVRQGGRQAAGNVVRPVLAALRGTSSRKVAEEPFSGASRGLDAQHLMLKHAGSRRRVRSQFSVGFCSSSVGDLLSKCMFVQGARTDRNHKQNSV